MFHVPALDLNLLLTWHWQWLYKAIIRISWIERLLSSFFPFSSPPLPFFCPPSLFCLSFLCHISSSLLLPSSIFSFSRIHLEGIGKLKWQLFRKRGGSCCNVGIVVVVVEMLSCVAVGWCEGQRVMKSRCWSCSSSCTRRTWNWPTFVWKLCRLLTNSNSCETPWITWRLNSNGALSLATIVVRLFFFCFAILLFLSYCNSFCTWGDEDAI